VFVLESNVFSSLSARQLVTENYLEEKANVGGYGSLIAISGK